MRWDRSLVPVVSTSRVLEKSRGFRFFLLDTHVRGLLAGEPGYTACGWFVERGAHVTLENQVWNALPGSSSYFLGRNVGHFHIRP